MDRSHGCNPDETWDVKSCGVISERDLHVGESLNPQMSRFPWTGGFWTRRSGQRLISSRTLRDFFFLLGIRGRRRLSGTATQVEGSLSGVHICEDPGSLPVLNRQTSVIPVLKLNDRINVYAHTPKSSTSTWVLSFFYSLLETKSGLRLSRV